MNLLIFNFLQQIQQQLLPNQTVQSNTQISQQVQLSQPQIQQVLYNDFIF